MNGDSIRVYVETESWGHSWLSVGEGDDMVVYSYGRFDGTYKGERGIHFLNSAANGEGVLLRLTGEQAKEYQLDKEKLGMATFVVTDLEDAEVAEMLDEKFYSSNELPDKKGGDYYQDSAAHIIDGYKINSNNCTTFVSDVLNTLGSQALNGTQLLQTSTFGTVTMIPTKQRFIYPASLKRHLEIKSRSGDIVYKSN